MTHFDVQVDYPSSLFPPGGRSSGSRPHTSIEQTSGAKQTNDPRVTGAKCETPKMGDVLLQTCSGSMNHWSNLRTPPCQLPKSTDGWSPARSPAAIERKSRKSKNLDLAPTFLRRRST